LLSRSSIASILFSKNSKYSLSAINACLTDSTRPALYCSLGRVCRVLVSIYTAAGCQNAPNAFLLTVESTPVFPPTLESAWATVVVGICTTDTPLLKMAAQKAAISPTVPPPRATTRLSLPNLAVSIDSIISVTVFMFFDTSPGGSITKCSTLFLPMSAAKWPAFTRFESVTTNLAFSGNLVSNSDHRLPIIPEPISMG